MNDGDTKTWHLPKAKTKTKELPTLPTETSTEDSTNSANEKKVVVVKPGEPDVKISDRQGDSSDNK